MSFWDNASLSGTHTSGDNINNTSVKTVTRSEYASLATSQGDGFNSSDYKVVDDDAFNLASSHTSSDKLASSHSSTTDTDTTTSNSPTTQDKQVEQKAQSGKEDIQSGQESTTSANYEGGLLKVGLPLRYHSQADPTDRLSEYYKKKMNVIDLIPCSFTMDVGDAVQKGGSGESALQGLIPKVQYDDAIKLFQKKCKHYGLSDKYYGLKLYVTDETTSTDSITNVYEQNLIEKSINGLSQAYRNVQFIRDGMKSVGDQSNVVDQKVNSLIDQGKSYASNAASDAGFGDSTQGIISTISQSLKVVKSIMLEGNQISFPKIWSASSYSPGLNAAIKLFTPYGHPEAVKDLITRQLLYLIIMGSPKTDDGLTYGTPPFIAVRAHGLAHISIGAITNISFNRGGSDTSFNVYRQPLTIDVRVEFQNIVDGFAVCTGTNSNHDKNIFDYAAKNFDESAPPKPTSIVMPSLGDIVRSLIPYEFEDTDSDSSSSTSVPAQPDNSGTYDSANNYTGQVADSVTPESTTNPQELNSPTNSADMSKSFDASNILV